MASGQAHPPFEVQSPQLSTTVCSPQVLVDDEVPGPSAPCVDPSPWPQALGLKKRREWSDESKEETEEELNLERSPEPKDTWVAETLSEDGLKMRLKRKRVSLVLPEHHEAFNRLLEDPVIQKFLAWDKDLRVSDKYLLSMVIAYFSRAGLFSWQYRRIHFFLALYLASDMEEDDQAPKQDIFSFLYGKDHSQKPLFHKLRYQFLCSMSWRMRVSPEEMEEIQAYDPEHWVWARDRTLIS
uniref:Speedy/RINGO cell cycle regulator family member E4 n=1 Tax=Cebus imitator TaxID=2715852 RepID=A0A2K5PBF8_CEBIM